jgi:hypothetical protein
VLGTGLGRLRVELGGQLWFAGRATLFQEVARSLYRTPASRATDRYLQLSHEKDAELDAASTDGVERRTLRT